MTTLAMFGIVIVAIIVVGGLAALAPVLGIIAIPAYIVVVWIGLALGARRLHDRNKSAWWLLVFYLVPGVFSGLADLMRMGSGPGGAGAGALLGLIGLGFSLWGLVELGFLKGTVGPNRFGEDPLMPVTEVFA